MALANQIESTHDSDDQVNQCQIKRKQFKESNSNLNEKAKVNFCEPKNSEKNFKLEKHVVYKLYLNRLLSAWADRTWDFAVGLFIIKLYPESLLLAGIQGILAAISLIVISPSIGKWIEKAERLFETKLCLIVQNTSVILGGLFVCIYFLHSDKTNDYYWINFLASIAPYMFVFFSIMAQVWGSAYTLLLEKDWVLALAPDEDNLTDLNSMLRRIDLCMHTIASFACGILMQYSDLGTAVFLCLFNFFSGFCEYFLLKSVYNTGPELLRQPKKVELSSDELSDNIFDVNTLKLYKKNFFMPGVSFGLLYLTVLGFDAVTVGFLTNEKIEDSTVGLVSLIAGLFGIGATLIYPKLINKFGVLKTGLFGFIIKIFALTLCLVTAFFPDINYKVLDIELDVFCFLAGITLSRAGLWIADLAINQLIQTETSNPPIIGGVQTSINLLFELTKYSLVTCLPKIEQFWILILFSYVSVASGLTLYSFYIKKQKKNLKKL